MLSNFISQLYLFSVWWYITNDTYDKFTIIQFDWILRIPVISYDVILSNFLTSRVSNELGAGRLGNRTELDHSVGVVLELVAGDHVDRGQVWAKVHHSSKIPELPLRLRTMMDSAIHIIDLKKKEEKLMVDGGHPILKAEQKFSAEHSKSKILRILMKDEEV